jgi:hypothetical protein
MQHLYTCDEYYFTRHATPQSGLALATSRLQSENLVIAVNHYWTFFYDWAGDWVAMQDAWNQYLDQILALDAVKFRTFSGE